MAMIASPTATKPQCPFCRVNGLLRGDVLAQTDNGFLIEAAYSRGSYLIIPDGHAEALGDLPDDWWQTLKTLLSAIPNLSEHYNLSLNIGKTAGQSVKHIHFWIIPREDGKPSSGKGLARLIADADSL